MDVYFVLPVSVYIRFQSYLWNPQFALLQELKDVLAETYPGRDMRGDGQVVSVRFESYNVELVPAFPVNNGRYWICDANQGGAYKEGDPWAELNPIWDEKAGLRRGCGTLPGHRRSDTFQ